MKQARLVIAIGQELMGSFLTVAYIETIRVRPSTVTSMENLADISKPQVTHL